MAGRPDPLPHLARLALAQAEPAQPAATLAALDAALAAAVGHLLCTMQVHHPGGEAERVYSNLPGAYPVGGRKRASTAPRMRELMQHGQPILIRTEAELWASYPDHAGATALGCGSAMNTPVRWQGRTLGQVNLMHKPGWYTENDVLLVRSFAQLALPAFLALTEGRVTDQFPTPPRATGA
ncbi:GAF domain-containing protein [Falsiroseomonas sp. HC035]|uniref:GAF domain-containing protein n=1 Tax=Falsiroseomonas sp. HC035 TaxID=3390999 RepID=UPI003D31B7FD